MQLARIPLKKIPAHEAEPAAPEAEGSGFAPMLDQAMNPPTRPKTTFFRAPNLALLAELRA